MLYENYPGLISCKEDADKALEMMILPIEAKAKYFCVEMVEARLIASILLAN